MKFKKPFGEILVILAIQRASFLRLNLNNSKTSHNEDSKNTSHLVIDGNTETCSTAEVDSKSGKHPWWHVELDRTHNITELIIFFTPDRTYTYFMNNLNVYVASDANEVEENLCISYKGTAEILSVGNIQLKCDEPVSGKFVTIKRIGGIRKNMLLLCEIAVDADRSTVNLALRRPAFQSGILLKSQSALANDNLLKTCATVRSHDEPFAWWRVVLDDSYYITDVNIYFARNSKGMSHYNVEIYVSNDGTYFEDRKCGDSSDQVDERTFVNITCPEPIPGTFVTIKKYGELKPKWLLLCEVEIFSKEDRQEMVEPVNVSHSKCFDFEYKCLKGKCIHNDWLCDGTEDCPYGDDEVCHKCDAGEFKCARRDMCVDNSTLCDGTGDCRDFSDESGCFRTNSTNDFLIATFKGESHYFMCSKNWLEVYSHSFCRIHHNSPSLTAKTFHEPINDETFKFLTLKVVGVDDTKLPDMDSFRIGSNCEPGTYVKIQCQHQEDRAKSLCGTRGFPDGDLGPYIINGDDAKTGAWPWHVQIFIDEILSCGGSIIKEDWILTAAHCLANASTSDIYIKVGTNFLNDPQSPKIYVSHFESHPDFGHYNDIALIKLQAPIKFTKFIRPICLPLQKYNRKKLVSFRHCVLSGFGTTNRTENTKSKFLQQGRMNILSNNDCGKYLDTVGIYYVPTLYSVHKEILDSSNILCGGTIPLASGINVCKGDGGSPLVCRNEDKIWIQVGVATNEFKLKSGENCSSSIFTKVDRFLDFIRRAVE